jgi:peptidyl-prolyl cis-trans isomerase SurA
MVYPCLEYFGNKINRTMKNMIVFLLPVLFFVTAAISRDNNQVFLKIHNREVTKPEFERLFNKNNSLTGETNLDEYLEMFINFQLKVIHAEEEKLHLNLSFQEELRLYRQQLARPYLTHPITEEEFLKEAYQRMLVDVNASHILIKIDEETNPKDTLFAWEKAVRLREQILAGEEFEAVARRASDDPTAKTNNGNIGYFTAFQMVYPFEKAVYDMQQGEISMPVRSRFGYHIIRLNGKRQSPGEVKLQHILLRIPPGADNEQTVSQKEKITEIHKRLLTGEDFGKLAAEFSQDLSSAGNNGEMNWFGTGRMFPEFEEKAFSLKEKGSISEPFKTQYGWHIIKLTDKKSIPAYNHIREEIRDRLYSARDERGWVIQKNFIETLKKDYSFSEVEGSLDIFYNLPLEWYNETDFNQTNSFNAPLFHIGNLPVYQNEFAAYLKRDVRPGEATNLHHYVIEHYKNFVAGKLIEKEDKSLEIKYPEFNYIAREYYDGLLLFEITDKEIWTKAIADTAGLESFYKQNKTNYMHREQLDATQFDITDSSAASDIYKLIARSTRRKYSEPSLVNNITKRFGENAVLMNRSIFNRDDNSPVGEIAWKKGLSDIVTNEDKTTFFYVHQIIKPVPLPLDDIRGLVISDYQEHLEQKWVENLRKKYEVKIDQSILSSLKAKYNN